MTDTLLHNESSQVADLPRLFRLHACAGPRLSINLSSNRAIELASLIERGIQDRPERVVEVQVEVQPIESRLTRILVAAWLAIAADDLLGPAAHAVAGWLQ